MYNNNNNNNDNCVFIFCSTRDATYNEEEGSVRMFLRGRPINLYAPTAEIATYDITKVATAPSSKLKLDWVYPFLLN
jgi:echinoderm microtubule-associated protein-like 1/2